LNIITSNEKAQLAFGAKLAKACHHKGCIIFLQGNLGAGKTTTVRGFLKALGYQGKVKSPTYTLVETYEIQKQIIYHIDLYRIQNPEEILALGLFDEHSSISNLNNKILYYLIEWPEKAETELPQADITCNISLFAKGRVCQITAQSARGEEMIAVMDS
jgi:tRNA threonylcarbamoyladenosine biosynthesis protein TsaE